MKIKSDTLKYRAAGRATRFSRAFLSVLILFGVLMPIISSTAPEISAAPSSKDKIPEAVTSVDPYIYSAYASMIIDTFEEDNQTWYPYDGTVSIQHTQTVGIQPKSVFSGSGCAEIEAAAGAESSTVIRYFDEPLDLSLTNQFAIAVLIPLEHGRSCTAEIKLISSAGTEYSYSASLGSLSWNAVIADISSFNGRGSISSVSLTLNRSGGSEAFTFYADSAVAASDGNLEKRCRLLSSDYSVSGCTASYTSELNLECNGESPSVTFENIPPHLTGSDSGFRINIRSYTVCDSVTLFYAAKDEEFSSQRSETAKLDTSASGLQSLRIPVGAGTVRIKIVFNGTISGDIRIVSIIPISVSHGVSGYGNVETCQISSEKAEISGNISSESAERYYKATIALYILPAGGSPSDVTHDQTPYAERPVSERFYFSVPIKECGISSGFFVAIKDGINILPVDSVKYITNPERISSSTLSSYEPYIKKGLRELDSGTLLDGITQSATEIHIDELVTSSPTQYVIDDELGLYADEKAVANLDEYTLSAVRESIRMNYILLFSRTGNEAVDSLIIHPDADKDAKLCAPNTESEDGIRALEAISGFIAERYAGKSAVPGTYAPGFAVGYDISNPAQYWNMGDKVTLSEYSAAYAAAFRTIYNSIKSVCGAADIYIPAGTVWDIGISSGYTGTFDSSSVLSSVNTILKSGGDIAWKLAFDPYPENDLYISALDGYAPGSTDAEYITMKNLHLLTYAVMRPELQYNGQHRHILILEQRENMLIPSDNLRELAADYVYSYYKVNSKNFTLIEGFIPYRDINYNSILSIIDTKDSINGTAFARTCLGAENWQQLIEGFDETMLPTRTVDKIPLLHTMPTEKTGSTVIFSFGDKSNAGGWIAGESCSKIASGVSMTGHAGLLSAYFSDIPQKNKSAVCIFPSVYDFTKAPYITTDIMVAGLGYSADPVKLSIYLYAGSDCIIAEDELKPNTWTSIVLPVNKFPSAAECDRMIIRISGNEGNGAGDPILLIGEISACSTEYSDSEVYASIFEKGDRQTDNILRSRKSVTVLAVVIAVCILLILIRKIPVSTTKRANGRNTK